MNKYTDDVKVRVERAVDDDDMWCWSVLINGGEYDSGYAASETEAQWKATLALNTWKQMNV